MSEKRYSLHEVTESLRISPDTLYRWEKQIPDLKPEHCEGGRFYTGWEFDLVQHAYRLYHNYNQDFAGTRSALERWISKNPKPIPEAKFDEIEEETDNIGTSSQTVQVDLNQVKQDLSIHQNDVENKNETAVKQEKIPQESSSSDQFDLDAKTRPLLSNTTLSAPSIIQQSGGKRRVIGRSNEDLFSDLDSDPFDLSPSPRGRFKDFEIETSVHDQAEKLSPSLVNLERNFSAPQSSSWSGSYSNEPSSQGTYKNFQSQSRDKQPSASDWLDGATALDIEAVNEAKNIVEVSRQTSSSVTEDAISAVSSPIITSPTMTDSTMAKKPFKPQRAFSEEVPVLNVPKKKSEENISTKDDSHHPNGINQDKLVDSTLDQRFKAVAKLTPIPAKKAIQTPYGSGSKVPYNHVVESVSYQGGLKMPENSLAPSAVTNPAGRSRVGSSPFGAEDSNKLKGNISISSSSSEFKDQESWQRAYNHAQAQLARAKGELARAQDTVSQQKKEIKLLQSQLLGMKESVLKEIYDLRDLVVDK